MRIKINPGLFAKAAAFIADTNEIRHYLGGVHVEAATGHLGGVLIYASCGHMLFMAHDKDGVFERQPGEPARQILMARPPMVAACRSAHRANISRTDTAAQRFVLFDGRRLSVALDFGCEANDGEFYVHPGYAVIPGRNNGTAIDWQRVICRWDDLLPGPSGVLNIAYISKAALAAGNGRHSTPARMWHWQKDGPTLVQMIDHPEICIAIMPMRVLDENVPWLGDGKLKPRAMVRAQEVVNRDA